MCTKPMEILLCDLTYTGGVFNINALHRLPLRGFHKSLKIHNSWTNYPILLKIAQFRFSNFSAFIECIRMSWFHSPLITILTSFSLSPRLKQECPTLRSLSVSLPVRARRYPSSAKRLAIPAPIPELAPKGGEIFIMMILSYFKRPFFPHEF